MKQEESDYEKVREEQMRRNRERMLELSLPQASAQVAEKKMPVRKASQRGVKRQKKEPVIARRSLRVRGMNPSGDMVKGIASESAGGVKFESTNLGYGSFSVEPPKPSRKTGPVKFQSIFEDDEDELKMLEILRSKSSIKCSSSPTGLDQLSDLDLKEESIMKVTKSGSVHLGIMPRADMIMIAAGDKAGQVGFWSVSQDFSQQCKLQVEPHSQYISGLKWCPSTGKDLFTCSYDGACRKLDLDAESFLEIYSSEEHEFSACDVDSAGNTVYLGDNDGQLLVFDIRSGKVVFGPKTLSTRKINTVHIEPSAENMIVTSSTSAEVSIWDVRKAGKKNLYSRMLNYIHPKSCQGAYFAPDGSQRILTTCYDNHLRVWDAKKAGNVKVPEVRISHNTQTGRWVLPFRAIWSPASDGVICGSMKRGVRIELKLIHFFWSFLLTLLHTGTYL